MSCRSEGAFGMPGKAPWCSLPECDLVFSRRGRSLASAETAVPPCRPLGRAGTPALARGKSAFFLTSGWCRTGRRRGGSNRLSPEGQTNWGVLEVRATICGLRR